MKIVKDTNAEYHAKKEYISASGLKMNCCTYGYL
jgi:hypothetical protein